MDNSQLATKKKKKQYLHNSMNIQLKSIPVGPSMQGMLMCCRYSKENQALNSLFIGFQLKRF